MLYDVIKKMTKFWTFRYRGRHRKECLPNKQGDLMSLITLCPHLGELTYKILTLEGSGNLHCVRHPQITLSNLTKVAMC
jgi:hypothetical protein